MKNETRVPNIFAMSLAMLVLVGADIAEAQQNWPNGPLHIFVGFAAGGGSDRQARVLAGPLEEELGVPVTIQNLPGGGGQVAAMALLREPADAPLILAINEPDLTMGDVVTNAPYDRSDFDIIAVEVVDPRILLVPQNSPYESFGDFVEAANAEPGKLTISTAQGNAQELFAHWLVDTLGLDVRVVGYRGGSEAANAMLGGHVDATLGDDFSRLNIRQQSRALVVASHEESPNWPEAERLADVMASYDVEIPSPDFLARYGVYAVKSQLKQEYPERYELLQQAILNAMQSDSYLESVENLGLSDFSLRESGEEYVEIFELTREALLQFSRQ